MKVVVYQGQNKFTVNNISIPQAGKLTELLNQKLDEDQAIIDLKLYNFKITSTRGALNDEWDTIEDEELEREIEEGINWRQETVN